MKKQNYTGKILGRAWDQIQRAQQGDSSALHGGPIKPISNEAHAAQIMADVARFNLSVHKDVASTYNLTLPASYALVGDVWTHQA